MSSKKEDRLLKDEEILDNPFDRSIGWRPDGVSPRDIWIAKAQDTKSYAQALKDVGEAFELYRKTGHLNRTVVEWFIEALKRGELPEEEK